MSVYESVGRFLIGVLIGYALGYLIIMTAMAKNVESKPTKPAIYCLNEGKSNNPRVEQEVKVGECGIDITSKEKSGSPAKSK